LFNAPQDLTTDGASLYISDTNANVIRKMVLATGDVTTFAGSVGMAGTADGTGTGATFTSPQAITTDGTNLYVADNSHIIRKIVIATGVVTTIAGQANTCTYVDGTGTNATFCYIRGMTTDGTNLYVSDAGNSAIRQVVIASSVVTTLAGGTQGFTDAAGTSAKFWSPMGITTDGTNLYVSDGGNHAIRQVVIATGGVTTLAGTGSSGHVDATGTLAQFASPWGIATDGVNLYVVEQIGETVRKLVIATGVVTTIAGNPYSYGSLSGTGTAASFNTPTGLTSDGSSLYIANQAMHSIGKIQ
jgi:hypothetical protein